MIFDQHPQWIPLKTIRPDSSPRMNNDYSDYVSFLMDDLTIMAGRWDVSNECPIFSHPTEKKAIGWYPLPLISKVDHLF